MPMRKFVFPLIILLLIVSSGCTLKSERNNFVLAPDKIKTAVKGWRTYTNPAYRYELRYPLDWSVKDSGEDGKKVEFFSGTTDSQILTVAINSFSNWQEKYSLSEFYAKQPENILAAGYKQAEIELAGEKAIWIQDVKTKGKIGDFEIDLFVFWFDDRIVEIGVYQTDENSRTVINSLKFYPNQIFP